MMLENEADFLSGATDRPISDQKASKQARHRQASKTMRSCTLKSKQKSTHLATMRNSVLFAFVAGPVLASAFQTPSTSLRSISLTRLQSQNDDELSLSSTRRSAVKNMASALLTASSLMVSIPRTAAAKSDPDAKTGAYDTSNRAPEFVQKYDDFQLTDEGWSFKDVKPGTGDVKIEDGDRVVFDWSGYTIGYFGRPFEAKGGPQGGAFDKDLDYQRTVVGSGNVVKGLECALRSMKPGGVRQVVVPYGPLSYPPDDLEHNRVGPKPTTFSGQRALNFVLENPRVDRTLLFNVKVIRVDKKDGKGGFLRG